MSTKIEEYAPSPASDVINIDTRPQSHIKFLPFGYFKGVTKLSQVLPREIVKKFMKFNLSHTCK